MNKDLKDLTLTASNLAANHQAIEQWLESIVWVATTPDKKSFTAQMQQLSRLRKDGKRIQKKLETLAKKIKPGV